jgi:hypothetical protein
VAAVVTGNVADVPLAGTVTLDGTMAAAELVPRANSAPPAGAGPFRVTEPIEFDTPPCTAVGFKPTEVRAAGRTVKVPDCAGEPLAFAEIATSVDEPTAIGVTVNVADTAFAGMVTLAGTVAAFVLPLISVIVIPPEPAGPLIVTVPVAV